MELSSKRNLTPYKESITTYCVFHTWSRRPVSLYFQKGAYTVRKNIIADSTVKLILLATQKLLTYNMKAKLKPNT